MTEQLASGSPPWQPAAMTDYPLGSAMAVAHMAVCKAVAAAADVYANRRGS